MEDRSIKEKFQQVSTRDKRAAEYFSSEIFMKECRDEIDKCLINKGWSVANVQPSIVLKEQDMVYICSVFDKLKKEYPELNHARIDSHNYVIFDTEPDTFFRKAERLIFFLHPQRMVKPSP